jgi:DNA-binding LacI/PurR family transcriptional regulator
MNPADQIEQAATDALLTVAEVCEKAGVHITTFRRARKNSKMRQATKVKLLRAIKELSA